MPAEAHWRGRPFLVNELIETCGDSNFLSSDEGGAVIQAIEGEIHAGGKKAGQSGRSFEAECHKYAVLL